MKVGAGDFTSPAWTVFMCVTMTGLAILSFVYGFWFHACVFVFCMVVTIFAAIAPIFMYYHTLHSELLLLETVAALRRCAEQGLPFASEELHLAYDGKGVLTISRPDCKPFARNVVIYDALPEEYPRPEITRHFACSQYEQARDARRDGVRTVIQFTSGKELGAWAMGDGAGVFEYDGTFAVLTPVK